MRVTSNGSVGIPVNWKGLPGREAVPFDTAFPFVANAPQIDPVPLMERAVIEDGSFSDTPLKTCSNPGAPKIQKADDDGAKPKKRKASRQDDDDSGPAVTTRTRTVRRKRTDDDNDGWGNGARATDIIKGGIGIGIGIGGGYGGGHGK